MFNEHLLRQPKVKLLQLLQQQIVPHVEAHYRTIRCHRSATTSQRLVCFFFSRFLPLIICRTLADRRSTTAASPSAAVPTEIVLSSSSSTYFIRRRRPKPCDNPGGNQPPGRRGRRHSTVLKTMQAMINAIFVLEI
jgi:hypothetical protein